MKNTQLTSHSTVKDCMPSHKVKIKIKMKAFVFTTSITEALLFTSTLKVLVGQFGKKKNKRHPNLKGRSKTVSICTCHVWHIEYSKESTHTQKKKLSELIKEFNKAE